MKIVNAILATKYSTLGQNKKLYLLAKITILSAQKVPAGRFSGSKYYFIRPKGPCGTLFRLKIQFYPPKKPLRDAFLAQNTDLSGQKAPAGRLSVIPKVKYMTLGAKS